MAFLWSRQKLILVSDIKMDIKSPNMNNILWNIYKILVKMVLWPTHDGTIIQISLIPKTHRKDFFSIGLTIHYPPKFIFHLNIFVVTPKMNFGDKQYLIV